MKKSHLSIFLIGLIVMLSACKSKKELNSYQVTRFAMGTVIKITVLDYSEEHADKAIEAAIAEINRIGSLFYEKNPESPLYAFSNRTKDRVAMPREVLNLVQRGMEISDITNGDFDMTVGILLELYDFKSEHPKPPSLEAIQAVLPYVDYHALVIDTIDNVLISKSPKTMLTTGGIAKGYGVDRAMKILQEFGIKGALVNAGGDLQVMPRPDGKKWRIGVQDPRNPEKLLDIIEVEDGSVVTSGDYQKFFFYEGKRYHHIINPKTGLPADSCQSVTIVAPNSEMADGLATGISVAGVAKGLKILESLPGCDGMIVRYDGKVFKSSGFIYSSSDK